MNNRTDEILIHLNEKTIILQKDTESKCGLGLFWSLKQ
jgi:hypothetical protein